MPDFDSDASGEGRDGESKPRRDNRGGPAGGNQGGRPGRRDGDRRHGNGSYGRGDSSSRGQRKDFGGKSSSRNDRSFGDRPHRSGGSGADKSAGPRREFGDRPVYGNKSRSDSPRRDERSSGERGKFDKPRGPRKDFGDKPRFDKPRGGDRRDEGRPGDRQRRDDRGFRGEGQRRGEERRRNDRGPSGRPRFDGSRRDDRSRGDRPQRPGKPNYDKPRKDFGDKPRFEKPRGERREFDKPRGDRPAFDRSRSDDRSDWPRGDKKDYGHRGHDKPRGGKPHFDKPRSDNPRGEKPAYDKPRGGKPAYEKPRPDQRKVERPADVTPRTDRGSRQDVAERFGREPASMHNFVREPRLPDDIEMSSLDAEARRDLLSLPKELAERVGKHLVAAGGLIDVDPELALAHARYARARAARVSIVREAAGLAAYHAGEWTEALSDLRALRRMTGDNSHLAVIADCERALGRPQKALDIARDARSLKLERAHAIELRIVAAGARRDLGQLDAAVVDLQGPDLDAKKRDPWSARLFYAYADNLLAVGRHEESVRWFLHAAEADRDGETDASERAVEVSEVLDEPVDTAAVDSHHKKP